jgi:hypothetical protein
MYEPPKPRLGFTKSMCARTSKGPAGTSLTLTLYQGGCSPLQYIRLAFMPDGTNPPPWG